MEPLVAIVGPTGIGKSRLALQLAGRFYGEIVGADSRQLYRHLDIGTAKPSPEEMSRIPHHLINVVNPDDAFSLATYQKMAFQAIKDIQRRGKLPFLVGGSGLYVRAVLENWRIPKVSPDRQFRYNREKQAEDGAADELYAELTRLDPEAARKIDPRNLRRIIRALEVHSRIGQKFSEAGRKRPPPFRALVIGLTADRARLYKIVDERVDAMFARGLVEEVEKLLRMGYDFTLPAMSGIGYRQVGQYRKGELTLEEAWRKIKTETHRFIRHQYAWFRLSDAGIHWFDINPKLDKEIEVLVGRFLQDNQID